jgi:hypothetical protein
VSIPPLLHCAGLDPELPTELLCSKLASLYRTPNGLVFESNPFSYLRHRKQSLVRRRAYLLRQRPLGRPTGLNGQALGHGIDD